jgi:PPOX class probable F420-dependent enzyme
MELEPAMQWAGERKHAVLITIRKDGRPQSSDIVYTTDGNGFTISVTSDRAKTANMQRDPRIVLHITEPRSWSYLSFDGTVELSPATTATNDATADALVAYYESVAGQAHPDWPEYRQAMVDEGRLLVTFRPTSVVGQIH